MADDADQLLAQLVDLLLLGEGLLQGCPLDAFLVEGAAVRQVSRHLRETHQVAVATEDAADDHVGPEPAAVFAYPPALVLEAPLTGGDLQLLCAAAGGLGRVEAREMLSDDLVGAVALDALGADVPGADAAVHVQHEDGVVLDALHQETKALGVLRVALLHGAGPLA